MFPDEKKAQFLPFKELLLTSTFPNQGFTMLEVLAALMISFAFLMGALNGITMAVWMQVKAERQAQANYWIQQDLEMVKYQAATLTADPTNKCTSFFSTSYARALQTKSEIQSFIVRTSASSSINGNIVTTTLTQPLVNKPYQITRITNGSDTNSQLLTISYTVRDPNDNDPNKNLATLYTEIIPAPAMACP
jgi:prepilin-type N-terminal cleavage/methylation domain-containing protein